MKADILACWGDTWIDKAISTTTGSKISHLAVMKNDTEIIESLSKGLQVSQLSDKKGQYLQLRYKHITPQQADKIIEFLTDKLGTKFDFMQLFEILIFRLFRQRIHLCDPGKYICVESVNEAFKYAGINLFPKVKTEDLHFIDPGMIMNQKDILIVGGRLI